MKKVIVIFLQIALIIGFSFGFYTYVQREIEPVEAWVFSRDIEKNTVITNSDIRAIVIPQSAVMSNYVLDRNEILNKVTSKDVVANQYVTTNLLKEEKDIDYFETLDMTNYRLFSLPVDTSIAVGGYIDRGDFVDLLFTKKADGGVGEGLVYSKVFLQNIPIYKLTTQNGEEFVSKFNKDRVETEDGSINDSVANIVLLVTLEQAEEIMVRLNSGAISFVKRFEDSEDYQTLGYVLKQEGQRINVSVGNPEN